MSSTLESLRQLSTIVADTGDMASVARLQPVDATTNPSLLLKAVQAGGPQVEDWLQAARASAADPAQRRWELGARCASALQQHVERWVSLEADATLSYDTGATIRCAETLLERVAAAGGDPGRILIKIAATWEGIRAARVLESRGIRCNLTLIFALEQAQLCADGGITLISPFVGRITDWHKAQGLVVEDVQQDPGVVSVRGIYQWVKAGGYSTLVMGASFRNTGQILALAGCDLLTIAPDLLEELQASSSPAERRVQAEAQTELAAVPTEAGFRMALADNAMAGEKLLEGIRRFAADQRSLESRLAS